jgi:MFS family permease
MSGNPLDKLDQEIREGAASPVSGINSAVGAGDAIVHPGRRALFELPAYLCVQVAWFAAFGMQTVIFPFLLKNELHVSGTLLGLAQMALAAPSVAFILLGGVVAERANGRTLLVIFHLSAAVPAALLAAALHHDGLHYWMLIVYAVAMGTIGAFMMPARDAILNEVIERRRAAGSSITLQQGVAFATLAQFAAQIGGLMLGGQAAYMVWTLMAIMAGVVAAGAVAAIFLDRGRMVQTGRQGAGAVFGDILDGMRAVRANPVLFSMVASMFGVGVFVIGAFLVILPIINADVYRSQSGGLSYIFIIFWAGAFCSSLALSRFKKIRRPGRLLLIAQGIASIGILQMSRDTEYFVFLGLIFTWGLAAGISIMMSRTIVQEAAPPHLLARILSIYQLGFMGGAPIGAAMMGVIADQAGPKLVVLAPAFGMLGMIALLAVFTPIWRLRVEPPKA